MRYLKLIDKILIILLIELIIILINVLKIILAFLGNVVTFIVKLCEYIRVDLTNVQLKLLTSFIYLRNEINMICDVQSGGFDDKRK